MALGCALSGSGCYHYVPESSPDHARGTPLRVHVDPPASFELPDLTVRNIVRVDGEFVTRTPDALVLSAMWLDGAGGQEYAGQGWTVRVDDGALAGVEVKRLSWLRTGMVILGAAAGSYFGFDAIRGSSGGSGQGGGGSRPN